MRTRWTYGYDESGGAHLYEEVAIDVYNYLRNCWDISWSWTGRTRNA